MIVFSFALFALLIIAWLAAPTTEERATTAQAPALKLSEAPAD